VGRYGNAAALIHFSFEESSSSVWDYINRNTASTNSGPSLRTLFTRG
jgi:hypothetical protein